MSWRGAFRDVPGDIITARRKPARVLRAVGSEREAKAAFCKAKSELTQRGKSSCFAVIVKPNGSYLPVFLRDLYGARGRAANRIAGLGRDLGGRIRRIKCAACSKERW